MMTELPRGVRNNNPGNIDRNFTQWQGMAEDQSGDPRFVVFSAPEWGIRAIGKVLLSYQRKHGIRTVAGLIGRWAPPNENNTPAYIANVCKALGVGSTDPVSLSDPHVMTLLVNAIIAVECANYEYPPATVTLGVSLALGIEPTS